MEMFVTIERNYSVLLSLYHLVSERFYLDTARWLQQKVYPRFDGFAWIRQAALNRIQKGNCSVVIVVSFKESNKITLASRSQHLNS